jgi:Ala-tRNA(Pro) deacylase
MLIMDSYSRLFTLLDGSDVPYRVIDHPAEGRTDVASQLRGHALEEAAKCVVIRVALSGRKRRYVIGVVPGDRRVDLEGICALYGGSDAAMATRDVAERLTGCVSGAIMPFTFTDNLDLVVDPGLLRQPVMYFNAARLDRSVALSPDDYVQVAQPRLERIATERQVLTC